MYTHNISSSPGPSRRKIQPQNLQHDDASCRPRLRRSRPRCEIPNSNLSRATRSSFYQHEMGTSGLGIDPSGSKSLGFEVDDRTLYQRGANIRFESFDIVIQKKIDIVSELTDSTLACLLTVSLLNVLLRWNGKKTTRSPVLVDLELYQLQRRPANGSPASGSAVPPPPPQTNERRQRSSSSSTRWFVLRGGESCDCN